MIKTADGSVISGQVVLVEGKDIHHDGSVIGVNEARIVAEEKAETGIGTVTVTGDKGIAAVQGKTVNHGGKVYNSGAEGIALVKATAGEAVITGQVEASGEKGYAGVQGRSIDHQGTVRSSQGAAVLSTRDQSNKPKIQGNIKTAVGSEVSGQVVLVEGKDIDHEGTITGVSEARVTAEEEVKTAVGSGIKATGVKSTAVVQGKTVIHGGKVYNSGEEGIALVKATEGEAVIMGQVEASGKKGYAGVQGRSIDHQGTVRSSQGEAVLSTRDQSNKPKIQGNIKTSSGSEVSGQVVLVEGKDIDHEGTITGVSEARVTAEEKAKTSVGSVAVTGDKGIAVVQGKTVIHGGKVYNSGAEGIALVKATAGEAVITGQVEASGEKGYAGVQGESIDHQGTVRSSQGAAVLSTRDQSNNPKIQGNIKTAAGSEVSGQGVLVEGKDVHHDGSVTGVSDARIVAEEKAETGIGTVTVTGDKGIAAVQGKTVNHEGKVYNSGSEGVVYIKATEGETVITGSVKASKDKGSVVVHGQGDITTSAKSEIGGQTIEIKSTTGNLQLSGAIGSVENPKIFKEIPSKSKGLFDSCKRSFRKIFYKTPQDPTVPENPDLMLVSEKGNIYLQKQLDLKADRATFSAKKGSISNEGFLTFGESLQTRSMYFKNTGSIKGKDFHFKADRTFLNWMGGDITGRVINVDAPISANILGTLSAHDMEINSFIDLNVRGIRSAYNSNINTFISLNAGLNLPRFDSLEELFSTKTLLKAIPTLITTFAPSPLSVAYNLARSSWGLCQQGEKLYKIIKTMDFKDVGLSDVIPVIMSAKNFATSAVQIASMANSIPTEFGKIYDGYQSGGVKEVWQDWGKNVLGSYASMSTLTTITGSMGPHFNTDSLWSINVGENLGVNGYERSIWSSNYGVNAFSNTYTLNTYNGYNEGVIAASKIRIDAGKYETRGAFLGREGSIQGRDLRLGGKIALYDAFSANARRIVLEGSHVGSSLNYYASEDLYVGERSFVSGQDVLMQGRNLYQKGYVTGVNGARLFAEEAATTSIGSSVTATGEGSIALVQGKTVTHGGAVHNEGVLGKAVVTATEGKAIITGHVESFGDKGYAGVSAESIDHHGTVISHKGVAILSTRVQSEVPEERKIQGDVHTFSGSEVSGQEAYVEGQDVHHGGSVTGVNEAQVISEREAETILGSSVTATGEGSIALVQGKTVTHGGSVTGVNAAKVVAEEAATTNVGSSVTATGKESNALVQGKTVTHDGKVHNEGELGKAVVTATEGKAIITGYVEAFGDKGYAGVSAESIDHHGTVISHKGVAILSTRVQSEVPEERKIQGDVHTFSGSEVSGQEAYVEGRDVRHEGETSSNKETLIFAEQDLTQKGSSLSQGNTFLMAGGSLEVDESSHTKGKGVFLEGKYLGDIEDALQETGRYKGVKAESTLSVKTDEAIQIKRNINTPYSLFVKGSSVDVHSSGALVSSNYLVVGAHNGNIENHGGVIKGGVYTGLDASGDVINDHQKLTKLNKFKDGNIVEYAPNFYQGYIGGGTGIEYTYKDPVTGVESTRRLGLLINSGGEVVNSASAIDSFADVSIQAEKGFRNLADVHQYLSHYHVNEGRVKGDKYTYEWDSAVGKSQVTSREGKLSVFVKNGDIYSSSGLFSSRDGTDLSARNVKFEDIVTTHIRKVVRDNFIGGKVKDTYRSQTSHPVVIYDLGNSRIVARNGVIDVRGAIFEGPGHLTLQGKSIYLGRSSLSHSSDEHTTRFSVHAPFVSATSSSGHKKSFLVDCAFSDPLLTKASTLAKSGNQWEYLFNGMQAGMEGLETTNSLLNACRDNTLGASFLQRYGLGGQEGFNPALTFGVSTQHVKHDWMTTGPGSINRGSLHLLAEDELNLYNGFSINTGGDAIIQAQRMYQNGAKLESRYSSETRGVNIGVTPQGGIASVGIDYRGTKGYSERWDNSNINIGGRLNINVGQYIQDAASLHCGSISGHIDYFKGITRQDYSMSSSFSGSINTGGSFSFNRGQSVSRTANDLAGIFVSGDIGEDFSIGRAVLQGSHIIAQGYNNAVIDSVSYNPLYDYHRNNNMGLGANIRDLWQNRPSSGRSDPSQTSLFYAPVHFSYGSDKYRATHMPTIGGVAGTSNMLESLNINHETTKAFYVSKDSHLHLSGRLPVSLNIGEIKKFNGNLQWVGSTLKTVQNMFLRTHDLIDSSKGSGSSSFTLLGKNTLQTQGKGLPLWLERSDFKQKYSQTGQSLQILGAKFPQSLFWDDLDDFSDLSESLLGDSQGSSRNSGHSFSDELREFDRQFQEEYPYLYLTLHGNVYTAPIDTYGIGQARASILAEAREIGQQAGQIIGEGIEWTKEVAIDVAHWSENAAKVSWEWSKEYVAHVNAYKAQCYELEREVRQEAAKANWEWLNKDFECLAGMNTWMDKCYRLEKEVHQVYLEEHPFFGSMVDGFMRQEGMGPYEQHYRIRKPIDFIKMPVDIFLDKKCKIFSKDSPSLQCRHAENLYTVIRGIFHPEHMYRDTPPTSEEIEDLFPPSAPRSMVEEYIKRYE